MAPPPTRPVVITVMGILNIVFGCVELLRGCCGLLAVGAIAAFAGSFTPPPGQTNPFDMLKIVDQTAPWLKYVLVGDMARLTGLGALLLVAGIGLLKMRRWGRTGSIVFAVLTVATSVGMFVAQIVYIQPAGEKIGQAVVKWAEEEEAKAAQKAGKAAPPPAPAPAFGTSNPVASAAQEVIGLTISVAYAVALLVVMMLKDVRRAFAVAAGEVPPDPDRDRDSDDRDEGWGGARSDRDDEDRGPDDGGRFRDRRDY